jgi:hypothetical protein
MAETEHRALKTGPSSVLTVRQSGHVNLPVCSTFRPGCCDGVGPRDADGGGKAMGEVAISVSVGLQWRVTSSVCGRVHG